jgi:hypothetical protein
MDKGERQVPPEVKIGFETILKTIEKCRQAMKPGVKGLVIDQLSRQIVTEVAMLSFLTPSAIRSAGLLMTVQLCWGQPGKNMPINLCTPWNQAWSLPLNPG